MENYRNVASAGDVVKEVSEMPFLKCIFSFAFDICHSGRQAGKRSWV